MKILKINRQRTKLQIVGLMFLISALVVVLLLPKTPRSKQEYRVGSPWLHEDLYAKFDFPIYKLESEIFAERNRLQEKATPMFRLSMRTGAQMLNSLLEQPKPSSIKISDDAYAILVNDIENELRFIYKKGILSESDIAAQNLARGRNITILRDDIAELTPFTEVFTVSTANSYMLSQLATRYFEGNLARAKTFVRNLDLDRYIKPNLDFDKRATNQYRQDLLNNISLTNGMVISGQKIISKGEVVSDATYKVLESLKKENASRFSYSKNIYFLVAGQFIIVAGAFAMLFLFLYGYRREVLDGYRTTAFLLLAIVGMVALVAWMTKLPNVSILIIPMALAPMFIRTFYDSRIAFFAYNIILLIGAFMAPNSFEFILANYFPGVVAILVMKHIDRTGKIFRSVLVVFATYLMVYIAITLIKDAKLDVQSLWDILWLLINTLITLAAFQFAYLIEQTFGFLSDATLRELSDTNRSLLRELSEVAPGTFQHSLQVANLAEAATREVGGNPLLVRAGALYHDIGKMSNPGYFTENQSGSFNPHRNLNPDESAAIIIRHVSDGIQIARKHNLHVKIIQFIKTHHGTTKVNYFYKKYLENATEQDIDERFTYLGPKPETKEEALLMLADSIEAASRSLKVYTTESISNLVEDIVRNKVENGQLDKADITLGELTKVMDVFKRKLLNIYHSRVEYPQ